MKANSISYSLLTVLLRAGLVFALLLAGWLVYRNLHYQEPSKPQVGGNETTLQIVLREPATSDAEGLDISVELYPFDIIAARHEYFTERRAGKRFEDFLSERMKGKTSVTAKLDKQGQGFAVLSEGNWWLHAQLNGAENLEWRVPLTIAGRKQTVELTAKNVYTRTRSF